MQTHSKFWVVGPSSRQVLCIGLDATYRTWFYRVPSAELPLELASCRPGRVIEYSAGFGDNRFRGTAPQALAYALETCRAAIGEACTIYFQSAPGQQLRPISMDEAVAIADDWATYLAA